MAITGGDASLWRATVHALVWRQSIFVTLCPNWCCCLKPAGACGPVSRFEMCRFSCWLHRKCH